LFFDAEFFGEREKEEEEKKERKRERESTRARTRKRKREREKREKRRYLKGRKKSNKKNFSSFFLSSSALFLAPRRLLHADHLRGGRATPQRLCGRDDGPRRCGAESCGGEDDDESAMVVVVVAALASADASMRSRSSSAIARSVFFLFFTRSRLFLSSTGA